MYRADGYVTRFGLTYVDFETQKRHPKASAKFLTKVRHPWLRVSVFMVDTDFYS